MQMENFAPFMFAGLVLVMLIGFCAVGGILWIGGHDVFEGRLTAGELSAFVFYAGIVAASAGPPSPVPPFAPVALTTVLIFPSGETTRNALPPRSRM